MVNTFVPMAPPLACPARLISFASRLVPSRRRSLITLASSRTPTRPSQGSLFELLDHALSGKVGKLLTLLYHQSRKLIDVAIAARPASDA
jgi:hypothetical protein